MCRDEIRTVQSTCHRLNIDRQTFALWYYLELGLNKKFNTAFPLSAYNSV